MGLLSYLGKMFSSSAPEAPVKSTSTLALIEAQQAAGSAVRAPEVEGGIYESESGLILFREPVMDARNRLCGYRFLMRSALPGMDGLHHIHDRDPLFFKLLLAGEVPAFAARRMAVLPLHPRSLSGGRYRFLAGAHTTFLIDLALVETPFEELMERVKEARHDGCRIAFTGFTVGLHTPTLLNSADQLFLNMSDYSLLELQGLVGKIRKACPALQLAVEGVPTWAEQRMCIALGVTWCLGDFISSVDRDETKDNPISPGRITSIELLNLLRREAELGELSSAAKKDPGITLQLLKWANSPMAGLRAPVTSMDQAIVVLGRESLYRWLTLSIFRLGAGQAERDEALLEVALTRARFLETLAAPDLPRESRDELFLVGMLSLFEVLLAMPMDKILAQLKLSDSVADVLLNSAGPYGRYLRLALVMEKGRTHQIADLAESLGVSVDELESTSLSAFNWAQEALGANHAPAKPAGAKAPALQ